MTSLPKTILWLSLTLIFMLIASPGWTQTPATASLQADQTLEDLAKELFDDSGAADEIRALNKLKPGENPAPGTSLILPGPERQPAISALGVAIQAVREARIQGSAEYASEKFGQADNSLTKARSACRRCDYQTCQKLSDETWALARMARKICSERRSKRNRFAVSVDDEGTTRVEVMEGDGVTVEAKKKRTTVHRNKAVVVRPDKEPEQIKSLPQPPKPVLPFPNSKLVTSSVHFAWEPAPDAERYVLLIARDASGHRPVRQITTDNSSYLFRSSLADGNYYWFLRSVNSSGLVGQPSDARSFKLQAKAQGGMSVEKSDDVPKKKEH